MADDSPRCLPPLVEGNIYGYLKVTIDEILWCKKYRGEVSVLLQWWGENDSVSIRPADVSKYPESAKDNTTVTYNITTSFSHFETYLKQCNNLKLLVINSDTKEIIGHVEVSHLHKQITGIQYQKYFPVVTSAGPRIGDLRVDFDLSIHSIPVEISSNKMRKRSRRKNKTAHSSVRSDDEREKSKPVKKGCKTCSDLNKPEGKQNTKQNTLNLELPISTVNTQGPPNTERSVTSDCVLLEAIEKGKKIRDAMVLSVLDDSDTSLNEELLLKYDQAEKDNKCVYIPLKKYKNGEIVTPYEEKLINDYLNGKSMKEEEEILVLNTLHPEDKEPNAESKPNKDHSSNQEACCLTSKNSCPHSASSVGRSSTIERVSSCIVSEEDSSTVLKKINCFRLTVDTLTLTAAGWKKINQTGDNKNKNCDMVPPPGATYFVECHVVEESPRSQAQMWRNTPLRFCSRRQIDNVVYFGQSSAHSLRSPHTQTSCVVCYKHLSQRLPTLLGHFSLEEVLSAVCLDTTVNLPVTSPSPPHTTLAHLRLRLELGRDKLYYGHALLEDNQNVSQGRKMVTMTEEDMINRSKEITLNGKDLYNRRNPQEVDTNIKCKSVKYSFTNVNVDIQTQSANQNQNILPNYTNIPLCTNCGQNLVLSNIQSPAEASLCVSCTNLLGQHQARFSDSAFKISIPKNYSTKEQRDHEFLLGIDSVVGFPLFAGTHEELSCYVDYKFPEVTAGLKVEMAKSETTSRVVGVELQPSFSSVHRHSLSLPVVLPLSPLLASCSPGVTLRLWLRYYKPTPRDHMVALALLPMDELCLMELEFDRKQEKTAVIKVLELPLALVPSSVTTPYQQYHTLGLLRVSVTYSNHVTAAATSKPQSTTPSVSQQVKDESAPKDLKKTPDTIKYRSLPSTMHSEIEPRIVTEQKKHDVGVPCDNNISVQKDKESEEDLKTARYKFWTGPFGNDKTNAKNKPEESQEVNSANNKPEVHSSKTTQPQSKMAVQDSVRDTLKDDVTGERGDCSCPVMKKEFDILADNLEQKFNQLQSDLMKERQRGLTEVDDIVTDTKQLNGVTNDDAHDDFLSFHSLTSNSSMDCLPFILGPPADFKDVQNTVFSTVKDHFTDSQSEKSISDTISGYLKEEKNVANSGSNDAFDRGDGKPKPVKPKTFKAKIKVDRAVNLKAVKTQYNGKKGKVPPSSWVSFGTGDCCEQNCGSGGLVCSGQRFTTPVVRRNHNPIWNLAWDVELPVEYLQQVNKRLVFRVFEENLDVALGFASANLSILTSGLPCLSSWLSINDLAGACKGQIKVVVTPLEDVSQYQECSVFDTEEDEFEESKVTRHESVSPSLSEQRDSPSFVASETEVFVNQSESEASRALDAEVQDLMKSADHEDKGLVGVDTFSADDIISDYKNTLENNFRNEMAGLENLIKFLRVGSMSNELSFLRANENKENVYSNPSSQHPNIETRTVPSQVETGGKCASNSSSINNQASTQSVQKDKVLIDVSTETVERDKNASVSTQDNEDILSKLLQQISMFQLPTVKITDNTCQTVVPETKETFTETSAENQSKSVISRTIHMKDASTETDDICDNRSDHSDNINRGTHVCSELGSALLQHFLTCRPAPLKVTDSACQTVFQDKESTADSSGIFMGSQPSGMSTELLAGASGIQPFNGDWISSEEAHTNSERLIAIDNNIKDLERFLKENLIMVDRDEIPPSIDSKEVSSCGSLNGIMDSIQAGVKENNRSSSYVESLESNSQLRTVPRETPDGGNPSSVPDDSSNTDDTATGTTMRRRGTFVIEKSKGDSEELSKEKEIASKGVV